MQRPTGEASLQWVTQECDIRDYVIDKGDAFVVTLHGLDAGTSHQPGTPWLCRKSGASTL